MVTIRPNMGLRTVNDEGVGLLTWDDDQAMWTLEADPVGGRTVHDWTWCNRGPETGQGLSHDTDLAHRGECLWALL
jgi:hypothetical protein